MSEYMPSIGGRISYKRPGLTKCPGLFKYKQRNLYKGKQTNFEVNFPKNFGKNFFFFFFL